MSIDHEPRILFLYGSLRECSYSRLLTEEAARIITEMGAEARFFHLHDSPLSGSVPETHPKVQELRNWVMWSEGQAWSSPEMHGNVSGLKQERQLSPLPPVVVGAALVVPIGLLQRLQGKRAAAIGTFAKETEQFERAAIAAVMATEWALGYEPRDVSDQTQS
ncbi:MAG: NAD(P)H-dependent oxidoreductase [Cyanobacteriota bacterium]